MFLKLQSIIALILEQYRTAMWKEVPLSPVYLLWTIRAVMDTGYSEREHLDVALMADGTIINLSALTKVCNPFQQQVGLNHLYVLLEICEYQGHP